MPSEVRNHRRDGNAADEIRIVFTKDQVAILRSLVDDARNADAFRNQLTEMDLLLALLTVAETKIGDRDVVKCRRCGRACYEERADVWTHVSADRGTSRGCRAASFTSDKGWDETLRGTWKATPPSGYDR
jgi:hypothetical protein